MIRLWTSADLKEGQEVALDDKQQHYVFHVMRLKQNDSLALFNGRDGEWMCEFVTLSKKIAQVRPVRLLRPQVPEIGDVLALSLIKKDNLDLVLQKATELGVQAIMLIDAARSVVHGFNMERAQFIVREAAEQCERLSVPTIVAPQSMAAFLRNGPKDMPLVYLSERGKTSGKILWQKQACFVIGPEGGWTSEELHLFECHAGSVSLNLGRLILRAETAAIGVLAAHRFESVFNAT